MTNENGAIFHKCDFQVHTPRDANWSGAEAISHGERQAYASELVQACRSKGISAIAVTDHHDFTFFPYVKAAARAEIDATTSAVISKDKQLVVFPGVELTLSSPPCQAILLLNADFDENKLGDILTTLAIAATNPQQSKLASVDSVSPTTITGFNDLEERLNQHAWLKGNFIILPNITTAGHKTLFRDGFTKHYQEMRCAGGYLDGSYAASSIGHKNILEGRQKKNGYKSIAVFQTSDNRKRDHSDLGIHSTYVKWSEPTAEALRQACLANRSRVSHKEPILPLHQIFGVMVSSSAFLGKVELELNPQFNAFIGGRGTGKSSLLEYIRWALCDDPPTVFNETVELPNFQRRRKVLIDDTLRPVNAKVTVFYKKNEVLYQIERSITNGVETINVLDTTNASQVMTQEQVRREFPVVSYAQKQLSCVGTLPEEINRLITDPVKEALAQVQDRIEKGLLPQLREQRTKELKLASLNGQLVELTVSIKSKKEQVQALEKQLLSLTPDQQAVVKIHDILSQQDQWLTRAIELPERIAHQLGSAQDQIAAISKILLPNGLPEQSKVQQIVDDAVAFQDKVAGQLANLISEVQPHAHPWLRPERQSALKEMRGTFVAHQTEYDNAIKASAKNKAQLDEIQSLNRSVTELEAKYNALESERNTLKVIFDEIGTTAWDSFLATLEERANLLRRQCSLISGQANQEFKAELAFCSDEEPVRGALDTLIQGKNVKDREQKVGVLATFICTQEHPILVWAIIMAELDKLRVSKGLGTLPSTPFLEAAGFTEANREAIRNGVSATVLEQVRYMNIADQIKFSFRMGKKPDGTDNYIPFDSASPGQQATCLLRTLLSQSGAPLLIDQPEEDLDNEQIHVLSQLIAETKHNRQLLFVSHNANIVVNGDAELVFWDSDLEMCCVNHCPGEKRLPGIRTREVHFELN